MLSLCLKEQSGHTMTGMICLLMYMYILAVVSSFAQTNFPGCLYREKHYETRCNVKGCISSVTVTQAIHVGTCAYENDNPCSAEPRFNCSCKQCRSRLESTECVFVSLTLIAVFNIFNTIATETDVCGNITTPYFLETQDIVLECISSKPSPRLAFSWNLRGNQVKDKFIQFHNDTYIQMVIPNITAKDVREYRKGKVIYCINGERCLYNEYIQLEYYPVEPQNITCLVDNFQTLLCTWSLGVNYKFPNYVSVNCLFVWNVSTKFKINPYATGWASCPDATKTSCFWSSNNYHNSKLIMLNISVTNTRKNVTVSKTAQILRDEVLKPGKVKELTVSYTSEPTCVNITWESPSPHRNFSYNISYKSECESIKKIVLLSCTGRVCEQWICGLVPYTEYTFEIVSKHSPNWKEKGYPSDPVITSFRTDKAKPLKSPVTTSGLYLYDHEHLTLFWQPLSNCDLCSDDTVYEITFEGFTKEYQNSAYLMETRIHQANKAYKQFMVMILTKNSKGNAAEIIRMEVFPEDEGPEDSELIIEYKGNETECKQYLATIKVDPNNYEDFSDIVHTITWCKVLAGACKKPMYWLEDQPAAANIALPIQDCNETYKFGLITKAYSKTHRRMMWTDINTVNCVYKYNMVPKEPLPNIHLSTVMLPNTVTVEWEPYPCVEPASYVQNYIVTYCEALPPETNDTCDCVQKRVDVSVSNKKSSHTIKDLATGLDICIWVSANSTAGQAPKNKHVLFSTVVGGETLILPIIIFSIVFVLILLGLFLGQYLMKWYKQWQGNRNVEDIPLHLPTINEEIEEALVGPQYPLSDEPEVDELESLINSYDSQSETASESEDGLHGYTRPRDIPFNSANSINSQLSQFDGNVCIRGHAIQIPGADNHYASIKDLTLPDPYITVDKAKRLGGNNQNVRPSQSDTQLNGQDDGSVVDQSVLKTMLSDEDIESINGQHDGSMEDQTVSKTKVNGETVRSDNDAESTSSQRDRHRFSNCPDGNPNESTHGSEFPVQDGIFTTVSSIRSTLNISPYFDQIGSFEILQSPASIENPPEKQHGFSVYPTESRETINTSETSQIRIGSADNGTGSTGGNSTEISSPLSEYVHLTDIVDSASTDTPPEAENETSFTEDPQRVYVTQTTSAAYTEIPPSEPSALQEDKEKKHDSVKVLNLADTVL